MTKYSEVEFKSRADLRAWLSENHTTGKTIWAVTFRKHTPYFLSYGEMVSELLCWGWIDSVSGKVDQDRTKVRISPRNPKSAWSAVNKAKVQEAWDQGLMMPAGEALISVAKANGMWEFLDDVERLEVPLDMAKRIQPWRAIWEDYPRSVKRGTLEWIKTAKRTETRNNRIEEVVSAVQSKQRPSIFR